MRSATLYIKPSKKTTIDRTDIYIKDFAQTTCTDDKIHAGIKSLKVMKAKGNKKKNYVISIIKVIDLIQAKYPDVEIQNLGEQDFIICYWPNQKKQSKTFIYAKITLVSSMFFIGAAIAIMSFYNDADIPKLFDQIYNLFKGHYPNGPTVIEFFYSIGVAVGIITFFNHFSKVKIMEDPTPLEVEMRLYERDVEDSIIESLVEEERQNDDH